MRLGQAQEYQGVLELGMRIFFHFRISAFRCMHIMRINQIFALKTHCVCRYSMFSDFGQFKYINKNNYLIINY